MRKPERIDPIMNELMTLWKAHPDMRLGQLMEYVYSKVDGDAHPYFVEDNQWLQALIYLNSRKDNDND